MSDRLGLSLRVFATLLLISLCVELVSLSWRHPERFLLTVVAGGVAIATGSLVLMYKVVAVPQTKQGA